MTTLRFLSLACLTLLASTALANQEPTCDICGLFFLSSAGDTYGPVEISHNTGSFSVDVVHADGDGDLFCSEKETVSPTDYIWSSEKPGSATESISFSPTQSGTLYCIVEAHVVETEAKIILR